MSRRVVVVGHGMVGARFVEAVRRSNPDCARVALTVLGAEALPVYNRVLLSTALSGAGEPVPLRPPGWAADNAVDGRTGVAATAVDRDARVQSPHKIKSGVSGGARHCAEDRSRDFGVIATEHGRNLWVGGNGGFTPRHARLLVSDVDTEMPVRAIDRFLIVYPTIRFVAERGQDVPAPVLIGLPEVRS